MTAAGGVDSGAGGYPPPTAEYVGYHAALRPDDIAIVANGVTVSYAALHADICGTMAALRGFALGPGDIAGVEITGFAEHWAILLALEALGAASFSYTDTRLPVLGPALADAALVLCADGAPPPAARRVQPIDAAWRDAVQRQGEASPRYVAVPPETPMRLVMSSGTTGSLKQMIHTRGFREHWVGQYQFRAGFSGQSRLLIGLGFAVEAVHAYATGCLRMGGTCLYDNRRPLAETLAAGSPTHALLPPFQLAQLLDGLSPGFEKPPGLTVFTVGAAVYSALRDRALLSLTDELVESYGTQEVGVICTMHADGTGVMMPGVTVEVVDEDDRPVVDVAGRIRVRSAGCVAGYVDDAAATPRMFRDGWFWPGDLGVMRDDGRLQLIGRADDVLNVQGQKFAPGGFEESLRRALPVDDLCLTALPDADGAARLWAAVVLQHDDALDTVIAGLREKLPSVYGTVTVVPVAEIPRTVTGKIRRHAVTRALGSLPR